MDLSEDYSRVRVSSDRGNLEKIIRSAFQARQKYGCTKAQYGDCLDVSKLTVTLLNEQGIQARLKGGQFVTNPYEDEYWDHSWVMIGNHILDPTVDQFFSILDVDLITEVPGIYYSELDGPWLMDRYQWWGD